MFNKNKERSLTEIEIQGLHEMVTDSIQRAVSTGEVIMNSSDLHDLLVTFQQYGEFILGAVYSLSKCRFANGALEELHNPPLAVGKRHLSNPEDYEFSYDKEVIETLQTNASQAIKIIFESFLLEQNDAYEETSEPYDSGLSEYGEQLILNELKRCLKNTQETRNTNYGKVDEFDILIWTSYDEDGMAIFIFKLSECVFLLNEPVEVPTTPLYWARMELKGGFSSGANSEIQNTGYETVILYVDAVLSSINRKIII
ncbi:hypothetical protein [Neobacillus drentensis]|uniref:hypothetical protein n=1 Tax=Neobacillus drentensis TaxID=220684 RepID=UPI002FFEC329